MLLSCGAILILAEPQGGDELPASGEPLPPLATAIAGGQLRDASPALSADELGAAGYDAADTAALADVVRRAGGAPVLRLDARGAAGVVILGLSVLAVVCVSLGKF